MLRLRLAAVISVLLSAACGGPVTEPSPASGRLVAVGGGAAGAQNACFTCHGFDGEGDGDAPRLAGLTSGYLAKQLDDYARGIRPDAVMTPIAQRMNAGERLAVSAYYAGLRPPERASAPQEVLALYHERRGARACADCHGPEGEGRGAANPAIAGQAAAYTAEQLRRWKRGIRRNDARDVMGIAARELSDQEIETLALYIERL